MVSGVQVKNNITDKEAQKVSQKIQELKKRIDKNIKPI